MTTPLFSTSPPAGPSRASSARHFLTFVTVNGTSIGEFDAMAGGGTTSESSKHTPGSSPSRRVAMGGPQDVEDVTVRRSFVRDRDHELARQLRRVSGLAEVIITRQPLGADRLPFGRPEVFTGVLQTVNYPEHDSESTDTSMLELVVTVDGEVG